MFLQVFDSISEHESPFVARQIDILCNVVLRMQFLSYRKIRPKTEISARGEKTSGTILDTVQSGVLGKNMTSAIVNNDWDDFHELFTGHPAV